MSSVELLHGCLAVVIGNQHQITDICLGLHDSALYKKIAVLVRLGADGSLKSHGYDLNGLAQLEL